MPFQNRVYPSGEIVASNMRGHFMGNRGGRIHDPNSQTLLLKRRWATRQWICCVTEFKSRHRSIMSNGYTELFFLDEVTALAAGHRPCYECRRKAATEFARCWADAHKLERPAKAGEMDLILHEQRLDGRNKRIINANIGDIPNGAMIKLNDNFYALKSGQWRRWSTKGYGENIDLQNNPVQLLTPTAIIGVLKAGYRPHWY